MLLPFSTKRSSYPTLPLRERGATLFEGLIAMLLMGIIGIGMTYILSRSTLSQTTVNAQNIAINQVRARLQSPSSGMNSLCSTGTTTQDIALNASTTVSNRVSCTWVQATVSVAGGAPQTVFLPQVTNIMTDSHALLGGALTLGNNGS